MAEAHGQQLSDFTLEITETSLLQDLKRSIEVLSRLSLKRAQLSIDDFGTGHSTFTQLQSVPANELKLDRSYVAGANNDKRARAILEAAVDLAKKLSLTSVAEGVEDQQTLDLLRSLGVDVIQGFLIAKPMPLDHFQVWRQRWPQMSGEFFKVA
jgi:EAL domain-containing protein (putative c-di-GMP-specific phosphodiesterase class I)